MIAEAERALREAGALSPPGRFGFEAAIQAVHAARRTTGKTDWNAIEHLYRGLVTISPTIGARVGHAISTAEVTDAESALACLDIIPVEHCATHQPYWAARAYLLMKAGEDEKATIAYDKAIGLAEDAATRRFLIEQRSKALLP